MVREVQTAQNVWPMLTEVIGVLIEKYEDEHVPELTEI
jgi:hypothetical protein